MLDLKRNAVRLETIAELTARVAKLEAAIAAMTARIDKLEAPRNGAAEPDVASMIG
jgi:uncharacterized small protein (DUF1192 family)